MLFCSVVLVSAVSTTVSYADPGTKPFPSNPEQGLTDQQIEALHAAERQQFDDHYAQWVSSLDVSTLPLSSLRHGKMTGVVMPPPQSMREAKAQSSVIAVGTVTRIKPDPEPFGTTVSFHVDRVVKGTPTSDIDIWQVSHLEPTSDWAGVVIVDADWAPLLLPGDRAILFLSSTKEPGLYFVQQFTGMYRVQNGKVKGIPGNPFASSLDGKDESSVVSDITAAR
jgi:hypothetical protein